jgi:S1-C subfamily serine protease
MAQNVGIAVSCRHLLLIGTAAMLLSGCFGPCAEAQNGIAAKIYEKASPSVFVISVREENGQPVSLGTGFLVSNKTLATTLHVVEGTHVFVEQGPFRIPATVDKRDVANDLAIISVAVDISATPLPLSTKKIMSGDAIFVIGNPEGLEKSISAGIVAGNRDIDGRKLADHRTDFSWIERRPGP